MPVTKKPKAIAADERAIQALINKGGSVATAPKEGEGRGQTTQKLLQLRLPSDLIERIDRVRDGRMVAPSRHMWLLEAIHEKLNREEQQNQ